MCVLTELRLSFLRTHGQRGALLQQLRDGVGRAPEVVSVEVPTPLRSCFVSFQNVSLLYCSLSFDQERQYLLAIS